MLQAASIYADASSLFGYARREVDVVSESERLSVKSALSILDLHEAEFERLHQTLARREAQKAKRSSDQRGP